MGVILYVYRQYGIRICAADKLVAGLRYIKKKTLAADISSIVMFVLERDSQVADLSRPPSNSGAKCTWPSLNGFLAIVPRQRSAFASQVMQMPTLLC